MEYIVYELMMVLAIISFLWIQKGLIDHFLVEKWSEGE